MKFRNFTDEELINYSDTIILDFCDTKALLKEITERLAISTDENICDELQSKIDDLEYDARGLDDEISELQSKIDDLEYELESMRRLQTPDKK